MNNAIELPAWTTCAGKRFIRKILIEIQQTVKTFRHLSLRELGHTVCDRVDPPGRPRCLCCFCNREA